MLWTSFGPFGCVKHGFRRRPWGWCRADFCSPDPHVVCTWGLRPACTGANLGVWPETLATPRCVLLTKSGETLCLASTMRNSGFQRDPTGKLIDACFCIQAAAECCWQICTFLHFVKNCWPFFWGPSHVNLDTIQSWFVLRDRTTCSVLGAEAGEHSRFEGNGRNAARMIRGGRWQESGDLSSILKMSKKHSKTI